jgi:hypothetical protein
MRLGVAIGSALLALALGCGRDEADRAPVSAPAAIAPADAAGRLDPAPYRAQIERTEAILYGPDGLGEEDWRALSKAMLELHNAIVFRDSSPFARETSGRIFLFSARADAATVLRKSDTELEALRIVWARFCADSFVPAPWIRPERTTR